jgi:3-isopropylmalate dehydrogenase
MKTYDIAVIGGDGTGPEVTREALKVSEAAARKFGFKINWHPFDFGGDRYLKTGEVLPDNASDELRKFRAIYLGAIGHPQVKPGILEKGILLRLRFELEQYINLRPVRLYRTADCPLKDKGPEHIDFVVVRENNEGLYAGTGGFLFKGTPHEIAVQESVNTRRGADRCLKFAFDLAARRRGGQPWKGLKPEDVSAGKTAQLTLVGKTNVLTFAFDLW